MEDEVDVKEEEDGEEMMMDVDEQDKRVDNDEDSDWNWEPDNEDDGNEEDDDEVDEEEDSSEVDMEEEEVKETLNCAAKEDKEDLKGTPSAQGGVDKVKKVKKVPVPKKAGKKRGKYFQIGRPIRTEDGRFKCRHCDQTFKSPSGLRGHESEKHSKTPGAFPCDICDRTFNSAAYLRGHRNSTHKLRPDGTPIPPKKVPISLGRDHICEQCGKGFTKASLLYSHVRFVHEKRFSFRCPTCQTETSNLNKLQKHQLAKHPEDPATIKLIEEKGLNLWRCPVIGCSLTFLKENNLKGHLKNIHGKDGEQVDTLQLGAWADAGVVDPGMKCTCEICGKIVQNRSRLVWHLKLHENEAKGVKFCCESCGKIFYSEPLLRHHVKQVHLKQMRGRGHKLEKKLKCEICGKGFAYRSSLRKHLEKKEEGGGGCGGGGGRDFGCDKCGRKFTTKGHLKGHKTRMNCGGEK